jgi:hypothetical protein
MVVSEISRIGSHHVGLTSLRNLAGSRKERDDMPMKEMIAEIRAAAASLITAAGAAENGDIAAAEIGIEDALFRSESLLSRIRQGEFTVTIEPPPAGVPNGRKLDS